MRWRDGWFLALRLVVHRGWTIAADHSIYFFQRVKEMLQHTFHWLWNSFNSSLMDLYDVYVNRTIREKIVHFYAVILMPVTRLAYILWKCKVFYGGVLRMNWGVSAWGRELLCSLVIQQWVLLYCRTAAEQLVYNISLCTWVANELYLAVAVASSPLLLITIIWCFIVMYYGFCIVTSFIWVCF